MTKEERDALREKCMKGLECHKNGSMIRWCYDECPYKKCTHSVDDCANKVCADALLLLGETKPDDQPNQSPEPGEPTPIPQPNPLDIKIIGARICGKYAKIGMTPDEVEIQIPGVITPAELPALVDEFNRALEFARQNKMTEENE